MTTTARRSLIAAWGLFASLGFLMIGRGLIGVTIGVRAELDGFSTTTTGVIMASYFAGFLVGSQYTPKMMARVGHIRVFGGLVGLAATTGLLHALWVAALPWVALQLMFGFALAGLYVVSESWLNETATNETRGRVMAVYMVVSMGGAGVGQLLLGIGDPGGMTLFVLAGALLALAVLPVTLSAVRAPEFELPPSQNPRVTWDAAPLGVVGALLGGVANSALLGLAAVYALQAGMTASRAALFAGTAAFGAVVMQWPIGHLSDYVGRRRMIVLVALGAAVTAAVAAGLDPQGWPMLAAMFIFGGQSYTMYSLALSHVIDVLPAGQAVTASANNVFLNGVGAIAGPLLASLAMTWIGPVGFWWTVGLALGAIGAFAFYRLMQRPVIEGIKRQRYLAVPARSTGIVRLRRRPETRDDGT